MKCREDGFGSLQKTRCFGGKYLYQESYVGNVALHEKQELRMHWRKDEVKDGGENISMVS